MTRRKNRLDRQAKWRMFERLEVPDGGDWFGKLKRLDERGWRQDGRERLKREVPDGVERLERKMSNTEDEIKECDKMA